MSLFCSSHSTSSGQAPLDVLHRDDTLVRAESRTYVYKAVRIVMPSEVEALPAIYAPFYLIFITPQGKNRLRSCARVFYGVFHGCLQEID
jgi:hypothetical protein